jgi:hypothetical protein
VRSRRRRRAGRHGRRTRGRAIGLDAPYDVADSVGQQQRTALVRGYADGTAQRLALAVQTPVSTIGWPLLGMAPSRGT